MNLYPREIDRIIYFVVALIMFLMFSSCSVEKRANNKLKRANKLIEKAKQLNPSVSLVDTVYISQEIIVSEVKVDTITKFKKGDSIIIENERLRTVVQYLPGDSIYIDTQCKSDTVRIETPVSIQEKIFIKQSFWDLIGLDTTFKKIMALLVVICAILVLIFFSKIKDFFS